MTLEDIYNKCDLYLFHPQGIEYIYNILENLGYTNRQYSSDEARIEGLEIINSLFELNMIEIFSWNSNNFNSDKNISNSEIMNRLENVWFVGADYPDFIQMPMFKYKQWYLEALEKKGFKQYEGLWNDFVKTHIVNLIQFIESNNPERL